MEEWKQIATLPEYAISNKGNVMKISTGQIMKLSNNKTTQYLRITISKNIHRLVAEAFIENDDTNKTWVDHIDGNRQNNDASNLRWVTPSENVLAYGYHNRIKSKNKKVLATHIDGKTLLFNSRQKCAEYFGCSDSEIVYGKVYTKNSPQSRTNPNAHNKKGWKFQKVDDIV